MLRRLKINSWRNLQPMEFEESTSSCLEELSIHICHSFIHTDQKPLILRRLKIGNCKELQSVEFKESSSSSSGLEELSCKIEGIMHSSSMRLTQEDEEEATIGPSESPVRQQGLPANFPCELSCLGKLKAERCPSLTSLLEGLLLPSLKDLHLNCCEKLESLPSKIHKFTSLQCLKIKECPKIISFPEEGFPKNLTSLHIDKANIEQRVQEWGLHLLTSLKYLKLEEVGSSIDTVECISSSDLYLPTSLSELYISKFHNLTSICFSSLPNLTIASIKSCPKFESFGGNSLPPHLELC